MSTSKARGFTLIEIMVVLAIIGAIMVSIAPRLVDRKSKMKESVRKLATLTREIHNAARLYNSTYRIVIKMDEKKGHSYSIESAPGNVTLLSSAQEEEMQKMISSDQEKAKSKSKHQFAEDSRILKKPVELPNGFYFGEIEYGNRSEGISEGVAYIHFFPQGLTEEAVIHLTDRKTLNWTIALHPITGRADLYEKKLGLKDLRN
jgi:general secretion pathway protein H